MPHLSPMSWITTIITFWLLTSILSSTFWWSNSSSFKSGMSHKTQLSDNTWKWLLQDGWVNIKL